MSKEKHLNLVDSIITIQKTICDKCHEEEDVEGYDEYDAADEFYRKGWRCPATLTYCPKCARKFLRKRRKK